MTRTKFLILLSLTIGCVWAIADIANAVPPPDPVCGNGICEKKEDTTCPQDCGPVAVCGDLVCEGDETCSSCESDCGACPPASCNSDGVCNAGEDCLGCPDDCPGVTGGKPSGRYCCGADTCDAGLCGADRGIDPPVGVCGDGTCDAGEDCASCEVDCGACIVCGDGTCDASEDCLSCEADCGVCPFCGDGTCDDDEDCASCEADCGACPVSSVPANQYAVGDSISEGEAAYGSNFLCIPTSIGDQNHDIVWSTGWQLSSIDAEKAMNQHFEEMDSLAYLENNSTRDAQFNRAVSGSVMSDFPVQAQEIVDQALLNGNQPVGMVSVLLGNNDVCGSSLSLSSGMTPQEKYDAVLASMTSLASFEADYRAALDILAASPLTRDASIHIAGVPAIYWLWYSKRTSTCTGLIWGAVPCQNLLASPGDDCVTPSNDPDTIDYVNDGLNCQRRKLFHKIIRDEFNTRLQGILATEYATSLPNAYFADLYSVQFEGRHVNNGDFFHPSEQGHRLMACHEFNASPLNDVQRSCDGI